MNAKFFIGPMTKNVVDAIIDYANTNKTDMVLIPSRRQVEWNGGYVNNWTTAEFSEYVKSKTSNIKIKRDHAGPMQGYTEDDGYESLYYDCKYFDYIHIDPWKAYPSYEDGLKWTVDMINFCYEQNPNIEYEIGTEQSIRRFEAEELDKFVTDVKEKIANDKIFEKVKYLVIQSGTSLKGNEQTGNYDKDRLTNMISIANKHSLLSKEHNGDYIPVSIVKEKFNKGLNCINIAPEFGLIETNVYIDRILSDNRYDLLTEFWKICFESDRWKKWVDKKFNPYEERIELIKICGHYVLSSNLFIDKVKAYFPNIETEIKSKVNNKLEQLYG